MNYNEGKKMGKVYKLTCNITGECYFGSTIKPPSHRLHEHKKPHNGTTAKDIIDRENYKYEVLERFYVDGPRDTKLLEREQYYITNYKCVNQIVPLSTQHDWYIRNQERVKEKSNQYYADNREKKLEYQKKYQRELGKHTCECGSVISKSNLPAHLKRPKHKDYIAKISEPSV
jgi:hypothetical protein